MSSLEELIGTINLEKEKSRETVCSNSDVEMRRHYRKKWSREEEELLCRLIAKFGSDFTLLHVYFPDKTRKQLKKKYRLLFEYHQKRLDRMETLLARERRKEFFDKEIIEIGLDCNVDDLEEQSLG